MPDPNSGSSPAPAPKRNAFLDQFVPSWQSRVKTVGPLMDKLMKPTQPQPAVVQPAAQVVKKSSTPAWQKAEGKNDEGGLNAKGRASYNKATGGNLKAPVTESNPKGDRAKRQNSFCARMCGMKKHETGSKTKADPDSRINKSLRKWNCKCSSALEFGKQAGLGMTVGTLGGLLSGDGEDRLRTAGRGAIKGLGFDMGAGAGGALGGAVGMASGDPRLALLGLVGGGVGGGVLGQGIASSAIGPYETEQEKFDRILAAREKEKTSMANLYAFGAKLAKSMCSPCDMPNGPANKKHMTGASPAVLDAAEKSEELGRPEAEETEHSETAIDISGKAAAFGAKLAAYMTLDDSRQARTQAYAVDRARAARAADERRRSGLMANLPTAAETTQQNAARSGLGLAAHFSDKPIPPASSWSDVAPKPKASTPKPSAPKPSAPAPAAVAPPASAPVTEAPAPAASSAPRKSMSALVDSVTASAPKSPSAQVAGMNVTGTDKPHVNDNSLASYLMNPYVIGGGLGAGGLAALAYTLMNQKKKKRRPDEDEDVG